MTVEIKALESNNTWTLVPLPAEKQCIGCRWVYKVKFKPNGTVDHHKARLLKNDYYLFTIDKGASLVILLVYVDDILLAGLSVACVHSIQAKLQALFKLKIHGPLKYFLGLEIANSSKGIVLTQQKYAFSLLEDTGFLGCKPSSLPMDPNLKLNMLNGELLTDPSMYRRLLGRLMYLTISRPDITFVVNKLSQYIQNPRTPHLDVVHHLLQYIKGTLGQGLHFQPNNYFNLSAYADAN
ncbi:uncharacterized mitochondrial protein AtMg00810-like [Glycine max]|uniref:uncharacterized mitochondrial protein AtMg00810-like n=1 Tax=Glycine max TaxID=3847 RepID=UPI0003DEA138|nr:uncharacterized mitochondrial protein AtMg00810-like [Glycine max]|eukprot:XP_006591522.1 uncharacterized protein LOC102669353 [Glycine max]